MGFFFFFFFGGGGGGCVCLLLLFMLLLLLWRVLIIYRSDVFTVSGAPKYFMLITVSKCLREDVNDMGHRDIHLAIVLDKGHIPLVVAFGLDSAGGFGSTAISRFK